MANIRAAVALLAGLLALWILPVQSAETSTPNDTARFLAGLPPSSDSPLAALTKDQAWQQHANYFNSIFGQEEKNHFSRIRAFSQAHLTMQHDAMFYMFSGPDFIHATSFFPNASNYVLAGLEPAGEIPELTTLQRGGTIPRNLHNLESSLHTLLTISYFITKNMSSQLRGGPVWGTTPVLYVFLARTGKTVHETTFVAIDDQGNVYPANEPGLKTMAKGVKIVFSAGDGPKQNLYYFSTNLADDGLRKSGFLAFLEKLGTGDSFVKSASYLLHGSNFSMIRNFLLDHSGTILQDDTGIPVSYFDTKKWNLQPVGRYVGPIGIFSHAYQSRLSELFRKGNPIPIDFGVGYRWRQNESNLLLAEKIEPKADAEPKANGEGTPTAPAATSTATPAAPAAAVTQNGRPRARQPRQVSRRYYYYTRQHRT